MREHLEHTPAGNRRETLLLTLCALFIGFFVTADLMGAKLWHFTIFGLRPRHLGLGGDEFIATVGIIAFPATFILTDIINEYFGRRVVIRLTVIAIAVLLVLQPVVQAAVSAPTISFTEGVSSETMDQAYRIVLGPAWAIVIGSTVAFLIGQLLDIGVFTWLRRRTGSRMLWLRAQGSTVVSQLIDSFVVIFVAFVIYPHVAGALGDDRATASAWGAGAAAKVSFTNYVIKFIEAVALTPVLYLVHLGIDRWLGKSEAADLVARAHPADPVA
ncbi:MAG: queuosine precursor transporter [Planctomycetes bacterium]|nr:queuosine precursor transporter [Planctomycetota bacterium]